MRSCDRSASIPAPRPHPRPVGSARMSVSTVCVDPQHLSPARAALRMRLRHAAPATHLRPAIPGGLNPSTLARGLPLSLRPSCPPPLSGPSAGRSTFPHEADHPACHVHFICISAPPSSAGIPHCPVRPSCFNEPSAKLLHVSSNCTMSPHA